MITINHSGNVEQLLYSLYFIQEILKQTKNKKCVLNLQLSNTFPLSHILYIKPLLQNIFFIDKVTNESIIQKEWLDICKYRDEYYNKLQNLNFVDMRDHPYILANKFCQRQFWKPIQKFKQRYKNELKYKILFTGSNIGISKFDFSILKDISNRVLYLGTNDDFESLRIKFNLNLTRIYSKDAFETAKIMNSVMCTISNKNTSFAIAEMFKFPRILYSKDLLYKENCYIINDIYNITPLGGMCSTIKNQNLLKNKLLTLIKEI